MDYRQEFEDMKKVALEYIDEEIGFVKKDMQRLNKDKKENKKHLDDLITSKLPMLDRIRSQAENTNEVGFVRWIDDRKNNTLLDLTQTQEWYQNVLVSIPATKKILANLHRWRDMVDKLEFEEEE